MTLKQALNSNIRIEIGPKVITFGGWLRQDRVLLDGLEIGMIQTRRRKTRTEVLTIAGDLRVSGYDIDWLVKQVEGKIWHYLLANEKYMTTSIAS